MDKINFYICTSLNKRNDSVAQLVEHYTFNVVVLGSNPSGITKSMSKTLKTCKSNICRFLFFTEIPFYASFKRVLE